MAAGAGAKLAWRLLAPSVIGAALGGQAGVAIGGITSGYREGAFGVPGGALSGAWKGIKYGALGGAAVGLGGGILTSGGRAAFKEVAMSEGLRATGKAALGNAAIGAGLGLFLGPTDSTLLNIGMGAIAGAAGGVGGRALGKRYMPTGVYSKHMYWRGRGGGTAFFTGRRGPQRGYGRLTLSGYRGEGATRGISFGVSSATIGATAAGLFAPAAGHILLGASRSKKTQAVLNQR